MIWRDEAADPCLAVVVVRHACLRWHIPLALAHMEKVDDIEGLEGLVVEAADTGKV